MAKARKRIATRKRAPKRGKASAKPARKKGAKGAARKRPSKTAAKMAPRKAPRQGVPVIEDTIVDVVDEPFPGVVRVTEYETIRTVTRKERASPKTEE